MNKPQAFAVAGIVVVGALLAGAILRTDRSGGATSAEPPRTEAAAGPRTDADQRTSDQGASAAAATSTPTASAREASGGGGGAPAPAAPLPLSDEQVRAAGIALEPVAPAQFAAEVVLPGEIALNADRTAHVVPRVAGVVEAVTAELGQQVRRGALLAVVASSAVAELRSELAAASRRLELARTTAAREKQLWEEKISALQDYQQATTALAEAEIAVANARAKLAALGAAPGAGANNRFELRAPFDGMVLEKHVALGEAVTDGTNLFTLGDLSTVWATFAVPARDLAAVRVGARAAFRAPALGTEVAGRVAYVGSLIGEATRTAGGRVTLANPQGAWRPGLFVNVAIASGERRVAASVPSEAIQTIDGRSQVFVRVPGGFAPRPVEVGASHGGRTEITAGLAAGETVATRGSFVLKSEREKGSAEHGD